MYTANIGVVSPIFILHLTQRLSDTRLIALAEFFPNPCHPIHLAVGENMRIRGLQSGPVLYFGTKISTHGG